MITRMIRTSLVVMPLVAGVFGCGGEPAGKIVQAPVTKEMEEQAEASSKYMMEQTQPKKAEAK